MFWVLLGINGLGGEALEALDIDDVDEGVELALLTLLSTLTLEADTDAVGDVLHTSGPEELVEGDSKTDVLGAHGGLGELADLTASARGTRLEGPGRNENVSTSINRNRINEGNSSARK